MRYYSIYTNPMSILTQAVYEAFPEQKWWAVPQRAETPPRNSRAISTCQSSACPMIAQGINHQTWFLKLRIDGEDAYPAFGRLMGTTELRQG
jgi:alpha-galactosidase